MPIDYLNAIQRLGIKGKQNNNQYVGLCPMHHDQKPSLSISLEHGAWTCFAVCGAGSFESLVKIVLNMDLVEAKAWIRDDEVAIIPVRNPDYVEDLSATPLWKLEWEEASNEEMPIWLLNRGFTWDDINQWGIRYLQMEQKILIPYLVAGELIGTITRNLKSNKPKYQNSFGLVRSLYLFGHTKPSGPLILIVEGPLDAMWLQSHNIYGVALLGTNLSDAHVRLLRNFNEICLAFDNDEAGELAISKASKYLVDYGKRPYGQVTRLRLPDGAKDVQDLAAEELQRVVQERKPV